MSRRNAVGHLMLALCLISGGRALAGDPPALPEGAKMVYQDDFNRKELGSYPHIRADGQPEFEPEILNRFHWRVRDGKWEIRQGPDGNGYLYGIGEPGLVVLTERLGSNFRVEYTAWSDNPGDRSLQVCVPLESRQYEDIYFFGVGSYFSTRNQLLRGETGNLKPMAEPKTEPIPKPGERCRVIVQNRDGLLELFVNGETVFSVKDKEYMSVQGRFATPRGVNVALYVWSKGVAFDDLVVYDLPQSQMMVADGKPAQSFWEGFQGVAPGPAPERVIVQVSAGCSAAVVDEPTVRYKPKEPYKDNLHGFVSDPCLDLNDTNVETGQTASVTVPFAPIESGEVEVELLAWSYQGEAAEVSLVRSNGTAAATLIVDGDGNFYARTPSGRQRLQDHISYSYRPADGPFYLQPRRWFTLRFSFDTQAGRWHAAVVNLFEGLAYEIKYVPLVDDLPILGQGPVSGLRVATIDRARLFVDNVCMAAPRAARINGKSRTEPLREILGLDFPWRQDPISLSVHNLRNEYLYHWVRFTGQDKRGRYCRPVTPRFMKAAVVYDRLLVRYALLEERAQMLERMAYHLRGLGRQTPADTDKTAAAIRAFYDELERLTRIYGTAFRDGLNEKRLDAVFDPLALRLEKELAGLEERAEALGKACVAAAGRLEPAPALLPGPDKAPIEWKNGRYVRSGQPAFFYYPYQTHGAEMDKRDREDRLLGLDNCFEASFSRVPIIDANQWKNLCSEINDNALKGNPEARFYVASQLGSQDLWQWCPASWLDERKDDPDILFRKPDGSLPNWRGENRAYIANPPPPKKPEHYHAMLNFWHPDVRKLTRDTVESYARHMNETYPGRTVYFLMTWEGLNYAGTETGFNENAVKAFRTYLKEQYGAIENLNRAWFGDSTNGTYTTYDEIDQRKYDPAKPNGLMYDFQCFRQKGYWDWVRLIKTSLKKYMPYTALSSDTVCTGSREVHAGLDMPTMFQTFDIVGSHGFGLPSDRLDVTLPMLDSLRKAYGTPTCVFEWIGDVRSGDLCNEHANKAGGLMDMFEHMAWGKSAHCVWYAVQPGCSDASQYWVPSLGLSILRYSTGYLPVGCQRSRRFGSIALTCPTVTPKVVVMEPTSSWLNHINAVTTMLHVRQALAAEQWNHGVVYENALLDGKQSLNGIETVILPRGVCLKPAASRLLLEWIKQGGTLIALLPPGYYNEYGQPDAVLTRTVMGELEAAFNPGFAKTEVAKFDPAKVQVESLPGNNAGQVLTAGYGKGRLCVYTVAEPVPTEHLMKFVEQYTTRDMVTKSGHFRLVMRESREYLYVFVVNHDLYQPREDTIILAGRHAGAVDLGCDAAFPVKTEYSRDETRFDLRLAPGEGTVIRLKKTSAWFN